MSCARKLAVRAGEDDDVDDVFGSSRKSGCSRMSDLPKPMFIIVAMPGLVHSRLAMNCVRRVLRKPSWTCAFLEAYDGEWDAMMREQRVRKYGETIPGRLRRE